MIRANGLSDYPEYKILCQASSGDARGRSQEQHRRYPALRRALRRGDEGRDAAARQRPGYCAAGQTNAIDGGWTAAYNPTQLTERSPSYGQLLTPPHHTAARREL